MSHSHPIRLHGPWQFTVLATAPPRGGQVTFPCPLGELAPLDFPGQVRLERRFGRPTNLDPSETVWLVLEGVAGNFELWLNGERIAGPGASQAAIEYDITDRLLVRNELRLDLRIDRAAPTDLVVRAVRLEIRGGSALNSMTAGSIFP